MLFVLVGILVVAAVMALMAGLRRRGKPEDIVQARIEDWIRRSGAPTLVEGEERQRTRSRKRLGGERSGWAGAIRQDLARADLSLTVGEYLLIRVGLVLVFFVAGYLAQGNLLLGVILGVIAHFAAPAYVRMRQARRLQALNRQLPDVLDQLIGAVRVGHGLTQSLEWVGQQMPPPAGGEFERVIREIQLGQSLPNALDNMVRRVDSDDLGLIVTAIKIQHESGGSLAEILETVAHTIRERVRIQREINVLTAQQRYSGYIMLLLPIALAIFLLLINPEYEMQLFTPGPTLCIPITAGIMMVAGFFVMRRIVDIEV